MTFFEDLIADPTITGVRNLIVGYAQGAELVLTNWIVGAVGEQTLATVATAVYVQSKTAARTIRGFASLDTSSDPGDEDAYDSGNVDLEEAAGFLSTVGENWYGTTRGSETFANGTVTFDNSLGSVARTFAPDALTFTWTGGTPPSPAPTYRNAPDPAIYVNADGTVTVAAGDTLDIPVEAEELGTGSNAPAGTLSLTTTLVNVTATNAAAVLGTNREDRLLYIERCRQASARVSLGGAAAIYEYLSSKNLDGTPLLNDDGDQVAITRVWFTDESTNGTVDGYFASALGAPLAVDVEAANLNIQTYALATPGAITFGPDPDGAVAATAVPITVVGTGKIKRRVGMTDIDLAATAKAAMESAVTEAFADFPIGGMDQSFGAGSIYTTDLRAIAADAYGGLYNVLVSTPAGASTALALGEVATLASATFTVTVVA